MWYVCNLCALVACGLWCVELCLCVCGFIFLLVETYLYVRVCMYGCSNILVLVLVYVYACVTGPFCFSILKGYSERVKCCPPARRFGPAFLGPLRPARLRLGCPASTEPVEPVACDACQTGIFDTGATRNAIAALLHAAARACFVFGASCGVGVPVLDVGM